MSILMLALGVFAYGLRFHFVETEPHWTRRYGVELPMSLTRIIRFYYILSKHSLTRDEMGRYELLQIHVLQP